VIRELLRQHRQDAARKVDRSRALARFAVERGAGPYVVADVGDGDDQAEAAGVRLGKDGVVEVARVLAVDRDERQRAQVLAAGPGGGVHLAAERARLCEGRGRKLV
jgi:hypothetical protein